ncbi:alpha carbonic anhydrase 7 [Malania oleifera]|uniref:alpha carbonic anhydrase 7 n=1 Tax=Malania oleifera TaxID=397392 RepID=UPI0025ADEC13|nr:alpha carbonic anhydrase 7 [Malania oleifera]
MEKEAQISFCSFCIIILVLWCSSPAAIAQEVEDEHEFSYDPESETGPHRWAEIHANWSMCGKGEMQSPIDMLNDRVDVVSHLGRLERSYKFSNATLMNRGHDMMLKWEGDAGHMKINGTEYDLKQCHWHSPSEHTINGERFDLELHMVHQNPSGQIAVVGILYTIGRPDHFLLELTKDLEAVSGTHEKETAVGMVHPKHIKIGSRKYYRYIGSLTTPPCLEGVVWTIVKKVRTVSRNQVRLLRVAVHDDADSNARPVQQLNDRKLQLFRPQDPERN